MSIGYTQTISYISEHHNKYIWANVVDEKLTAIGTAETREEAEQQAIEAARN
jgi:dsRNA-specific ribonuclease